MKKYKSYFFLFVFAILTAFGANGQEAIGEPNYEMKTVKCPDGTPWDVCRYQIDAFCDVSAQTLC